MGKPSSQLIRSRPEQTRNDVGGSSNSSSEAKRKRPMDTSENGGVSARLTLSEVVSDCTQRWFQDSLREARSGDVNMQVLVGQMYYTGYGVPIDTDKGDYWMAKAARVRPSVWNVRDKRPGYNASDSDSDESGDDS